MTTTWSRLPAQRDVWPNHSPTVIALAELADRVEKAMGGVAKMADENAAYRKQIATLTKRLPQ